jgi:hypothetical protein
VLAQCKLAPTHPIVGIPRLRPTVPFVLPLTAQPDLFLPLFHLLPALTQRPPDLKDTSTSHIRTSPVLHNIHRLRCRIISLLRTKSSCSARSLLTIPSVVFFRTNTSRSCFLTACSRFVSSRSSRTTDASICSTCTMTSVGTLQYHVQATGRNRRLSPITPLPPCNGRPFLL